MGFTAIRNFVMSLFRSKLRSQLQRSESRTQKLSNIRRALLEELFLTCGLHDIYVISEGGARFRVYMFFKTDAAAELSRNCGGIEGFKEIAFREFEKAGMEPRKSLEISVEIDSHERVQREFHGDYYLRTQ